MDKKIAEDLVNAVRLFEKPTNALNEITNKIHDSEERKKFRQYMAEITALLTIDILSAIVTEHPELDPYKNYFESNK